MSEDRSKSPGGGLYLTDAPDGWPDGFYIGPFRGPCPRRFPTWESVVAARDMLGRETIYEIYEGRWYRHFRRREKP